MTNLITLGLGRHYELISKINVIFKSLLHQGQSESEFYGDLVYKFKKIMGRIDFSDPFRKTIIRHKRISHDWVKHADCRMTVTIKLELSEDLTIAPPKRYQRTKIFSYSATVIMIIYNPNVDLVNNNVYTKFGQLLSIHSQDIEQKLNSDVNQEP